MSGDLEQRAKAEEHQSEESPLDKLRALVKKGVPIFAKDLEGMGSDIFRSMYFAAKAEVPNSRFIFPQDIESLLDIGWLVEEDPFGLGDTRTAGVHTIYQRGEESNEYKTTITAKTYRPYGMDVLPKDVVLARWEFMKAVLPAEEFKKFKEDFDVLNAYRNLIHGI